MKKPGRRKEKYALSLSLSLSPSLSFSLCPFACQYLRDAIDGQIRAKILQILRRTDEEGRKLSLNDHETARSSPAIHIFVQRGERPTQAIYEELLYLGELQLDPSSRVP